MSTSNEPWHEFDTAARKYHKTPVTFGVMAGHLKVIGKTVAEAMRETRAEMDARLARLDGLIVLYEARIKSLETSARGPQWSGEHEAGRSYSAGELVRRKGTVWLCTQATNAAPGMAPGSWDVFVKGVETR